jgi:hypothetical protein
LFSRTYVYFFIPIQRTYTTDSTTATIRIVVGASLPSRPWPQQPRFRRCCHVRIPFYQAPFVRQVREPAKPYPEFPLTAHPAGVWCKKIRGKLHYFGPWDDPQAALENYLKQKDTLHAGKAPKPDAWTLTVRQLANAYLKAKKQAVDAGELSLRTWKDYQAIMSKLTPGLEPVGS